MSLRHGLFQAARPLLASTSLCTSRAPFNTNNWLHTSAIQRVESPHKRAARLIRKRNIEKKAERQRLAEENKPHVVLGIRAGDEAKWENCDLAKVLVTPESLDQHSSVPMEVKTHAGVVEVPRRMSYGLEGADKQENLKLFFEHLPSAAAEEAAAEESSNGTNHNLLHAQRHLATAQKVELTKAMALGQVLDLRHANARGIAFENRRRIITAFSEPQQPYDTGRPEVQVALLTLKIRNVWDHLMRSKKDITNRRSLRALVHERAKVLKYLRKVDPDRYDQILERCALEPGSVEGELVV